MPKPGSHNWLQNLKANGFRVTPALRAVVDIVTSDGKALSAQQVFDFARRKHPKLGLMTVYRALEKLEELALIQKVHSPGGCHTYAASPNGHQHLLLCLTCGRVEYFEGDELETLIPADRCCEEIPDQGALVAALWSTASNARKRWKHEDRLAFPSPRRPGVDRLYALRACADRSKGDRRRILSGRYRPTDRRRPDAD